MSGYIPCGKHPGEVFISECPACLRLQLDEARLALEITKPSTIHILSGHVYGPDDKLVEFVDGCARCRIEKILEQAENRIGRGHEICGDCKREIDPKTCCCGDKIDHYYDGHSPVPMGCICGYDKGTGK